MTRYDKRCPRADAEALVRRRIDASRRRYDKAAFGLAESDRLADHAELVTIDRRVSQSFGTGYYTLREWGVKVNGRPAGYVSGNYAGTRWRFLPYWHEGAAGITVADVPDPAVADAAAGSGPGASGQGGTSDGVAGATAPGYPVFAYRRDPGRGGHAYAALVSAAPGDPYQRIGTVQRFGSLPSCQHWQGLGDWPGAAWTGSCGSRDAAAREMWRRHQERPAP